MRFRIPRYFPGWFVSGGGGSGGAATVQTDGVTIQGDGSAGNKIAIKQVETNTTLTGAGTVASPTTINGGLAVRAGDIENAAIPQTNTANNRIVGNEWGNPSPGSFSNVILHVQTADAVNLYDFGFYNAALNLVAHIGAQSLPSTGILSFALVGAPILFPVGLYYVAWTGNATTAAQSLSRAGPYRQIAFSNPLTGTASAAGVLPASIAAPSAAVGQNFLAFWLTT